VPLQSGIISASCNGDREWNVRAVDARIDLKELGGQWVRRSGMVVPGA